MESGRRDFDGGGLEPAGFWVRFFAHLLDAFVLVAFVNLVYLLDRLGASRGLWEPMKVGREMSIEFSTNLVDAVRALFYLGIYPLYYVVFHYLGGQTPGKKAFSIKVVDVEGGDITLVQSILRWIGYLVCDVTFGIGYAVIPFTRLKRGLHDYIAGTRVVYWR